MMPTQISIDYPKLAAVLDALYDDYVPVYNAEGVCTHSNLADAVLLVLGGMLEAPMEEPLSDLWKKLEEDGLIE